MSEEYDKYCHRNLEGARSAGTTRSRIAVLEAENKQLQNLLRDANKGAELNSKVSRLWLDEVTALRDRVAELTQALEPFAKIEVPAKASDGLWVAITQYCNMMVTAFMVRRARAVLAKKEKSK